MYVLKATFEPDLAVNKVGEMLALAEEPERLAEKLGLPGQVDFVKKGIEQADFKRLLKDMEKLKQFVEIEKQIDDIKNGRWAFNFMGKGFGEKKIAGLEEKRRKLGSLIGAPRWFYKQERVRLLAAIRDYAMEISEQGDSEWVEMAMVAVKYPVMDMFESGDHAAAKSLLAAIEKPFAEIDPHFVLNQIEGHRTLTFDFEKSLVTYYVPPRLAEEE